MTQRPACWFLVTIGLLVVFAGRSAAGQKSDGMDGDVLIPQKGHPLFGVLQSATGTEIIFTTDSGATVTLSWDKIKELQIQHKTTVQATKPLSTTNPAKSLDFDSLTIQQ